MKNLGKYELLGELGRGAFGIVYRARDPVISRMVALKTMTTSVADNPALLERFYREARSAGSLQHPNIVTIFDMGDEEGTPFIAMELVDGQNLDCRDAELLQGRLEDLADRVLDLSTGADEHLDLEAFRVLRLGHLGLRRRHPGKVPVPIRPPARLPGR